MIVLGFIAYSFVPTTPFQRLNNSDFISEAKSMPGWSPVRLKDPPSFNCHQIPSLSLKIPELVEDWNGPLGLVVSPSNSDSLDSLGTRFWVRVCV